MSTIKNSLNLEINISYDDVRVNGFSTEYSILDRDKLVYSAENKLIREALQRNGLIITDVIQFAYISGMFKPYGSTVMPATMTNVYTVILKCSKSGKDVVYAGEDLVLTSNYKSELLTFFVHNYSLPNGQIILKKVYKALAIQYHPDKETGNADIMKYLNELKSRYIQ